MRLPILDRWSRSSSLVASLALATAVAGCSSDVGRFGGEPIYTGSTQNQREILNGGGSRQQVASRSWSNVDTTGSIAPADTVGRRELAPPPAPMPPASQSYAAAPAVQPTYVAPAPAPVAAVEPPPPPQRVAAAGGWTGNGGSWVVLQPGETVDTLSRRYGVPSSAIVQANNFSATNRPMPGGRVLIPVYSATAAPAAPAAMARPPVREVPITRQGTAPGPTTLQAQAQARPVMPSPVAARPTPSTAPMPVAAPRSPQSEHGSVKLVGDYTVRQGDTIGSIARTYGVSEQSLRERNGLKSSMLTPGQHLLLPAGTKLMLKTSEAQKPAAEAAKSVAMAPATPAPVSPVATRSIPVPGQNAAVVAAKAAPSAPTRELSPKEKEKIDQRAAETIAVAKESTAADDAAPAASGTFRWPVRGRVISEFGAKPNGERNEGINLAVPEGTSIKAADDGEVIYSGNELKGYGNLVLVRHSNGFVSAYAHASELLVNRGDKVSRGQIIARAGATGAVSQPQLHFELRRGQKAVDPKPYLASN
jgi:murein DD-endopeptidase MepM/ murein hydrolase activator NlpD